MPFRIVITTTLNNNLFHAKLVPLLRSRDDVEVVVVSDRPGPVYDRVRWVWPKGWMAKLGRLGGRLPLLLREIMHPRTRLVMAYSLVPHGMFAITLGHLFRKPVYVHYIAGPAEIQFAHDTNVSDNRVILASKHPRRLERLAQRIGKKADLVFVPGSNTERFLQQQGYEPQRIIKLHSTIDPQRFYTENREREFDVLISAQLRERKRPRFTLEVLREVMKRRPQSRFCWLGDGVVHDEFDLMLDEYGLRRQLTWTVTDQVADYYRRARVFLLCSINEGLSLACMEAMACGMVPVVSDCGDMADIVRTGQTGELLPIAASAAAYADAVLRFLDHKEHWVQHSEAAVDLIRRKHSFESASTAWREVLAPLVDRGTEKVVSIK
jgi:glycosyltransferase involved in cell wall biosynthesis